MEGDTSKLCENSTFCQKPQCQLDHSRQYQGFCIWLYNQQQSNESYNEKKCLNKNCKLKHLSEEDYDRNLNSQPINGIYHHNLCETQCEDQKCQYVHIEWAKGLCYKQLLGCCKNQECKQLKKHIKWQDLKKEVYSKYDIEILSVQTNPENLQQNEKCLRIIGSFYCLSFLQGKCGLKNCDKQHKFWEEIKNSKKIWQNFRPCIKFESQIYSKHRIPEAQLFCEEQQLKRFRHYLCQSHFIDIIFIMDLTGSMKKWKLQMEQHVQRIIEQFQNGYPDIMIRVGFVGYRDRCDKDKQIVFHPLTSNVQEIIRFLKNQQATGGGDEAEDVGAGIKQALKLNISQYPQSLLVTYLICDSPNHGRQYHNQSEIIDDLLKSQIESNYLEDILIAYYKKKKNNYFFCIEITKKTQSMFSSMQQKFENLQILKGNKVEEFPNLVEYSLSKTIETSILSSQLQLSQSSILQSQHKSKIKFIIQKAKYQKYDSQESELLSETKTTDYWQKFAHRLNSNQFDGDTYISINEEPEYMYLQTENQEEEIDEQYPMKQQQSQSGILSTANNQSNIYQKNILHGRQKTIIFTGFDAILNKDIVIKLPASYIKEFEEAKKNGQSISKDIVRSIEDYAQVRYLTANIANKMAQKFRFELKEQNISGIPPIFYVDCQLYILEKPFKGITKIYGETHIQNQNLKWRKISSNSAFLTKNQLIEYYYSAFSHFSYIESKKNFVIVDLQGIDNILSDASIQSKSNYIDELQMDDTNLREKGIENFKVQHRNCSIICERLKINNHNLGKAKKEINLIQWNGQVIHYICETCKQINSCSIDVYNQAKQMKCAQCSELEMEAEIINCRCCKKQYKSKILQQLINLNQYKHCSHCQLKCNQSLKKCYYCEQYHDEDLVEIQNDNQTYYICLNGYGYLCSLQCQNCSQFFNIRKDRLTPEQYLKKQFICKLH